MPRNVASRPWAPVLATIFSLARTKATLARRTEPVPGGGPFADVLESWTGPKLVKIGLVVLAVCGTIGLTILVIKSLQRRCRRGREDLEESDLDEESLAEAIKVRMAMARKEARASKRKAKTSKERIPHDDDDYDISETAVEDTEMGLYDDDVTDDDDDNDFPEFYDEENS